MVAEEGIETVEGRVRLEQGAGPVLHESSQLETYHAPGAGRFEIAIESFLKNGSDFAGSLAIVPE